MVLQSYSTSCYGTYKVDCFEHQHQHVLTNALHIDVLKTNSAAVSLEVDRPSGLILLRAILSQDTWTTPQGATPGDAVQIRS